MSNAQWQALWDYEAAFNVSRATLYTYPGVLPDNYGLTPHSGVDTTASPVQAGLTQAGKGVFNYLNPATTLTVTNAGYRLRYDVDSLMFHQPNLRAYNGTNSLMGDLIDATLTKYGRLFSLPVINPGQAATGEIMAARMAYNKSGAKATLTLGAMPQITVTAVNAATVPMTGVTHSSGTVTYGGQKVTRISLPANDNVIVAGRAW